MIKILAGFVVGGVIGMAVYPVAEAMISQHAPEQSYARECLPDDECTMRVRPKGAPWLNIAFLIDIKGDLYTIEKGTVIRAVKLK